VVSGNYLKMSTLSLTYEFDNNLLKQLGLSRLALNLTGTNLFTLTSYTGFDPEVGVSSIDWGTYPVTRTVSLGVDIKF